MKKLKLMAMKTKSSIRTHRSLVFSIAEIVGVAGVSFVSYWTGKRVSEKIKELKEKNPDISKQEIFKEVWLDLLPMFGSVTGVIVLIILNEKFTEKEKAELITAIASGAGTIEANKRKRERLAKETEDHSKDDWIIPVPGEVETSLGMEEIPFDEWELCVDTYSGRGFWSTKDRVDSAIQLYEKGLDDIDQCCYNEFFELLGIRTSEFGDTFGDNVAITAIGTTGNRNGNVDRTSPLFETFYSHTTNGQPCYCIKRDQDLMTEWEYVRPY